MDINELKDYLVEHGILGGREMNSKSHAVAKDLLIEKTKFLDAALSRVPMTIRISCVLNDVIEVPKCGNALCDESTSINNSKFSTYCSRSCTARAASPMVGRTIESDPEFYAKRNKNAAKTYQDKAKAMGLDDWESYTHSSHFEDTVQKRIATHIKKTGYSNNMKCPVGRKNWEASFNDKHGVSHPMHVEEFLKKSAWDDVSGSWRVQTPEFKAKAKSSMISRYGVDSPLKSKEIKERMVANSIKKYGRSYPNQSHIPLDSLDILADKELLGAMAATQYLSQIGDELGVHMSSVHRSCAALDIKVKKSSSMMEDAVASVVADLGFSADRNVYFKSVKREADILIEDKKLIIEFNGMYWHSEDYKYPTYHQHKTTEFHKLGYSVVNVWEDDWSDLVKREIIINKIKSKLGVPSSRVFARKCEVSFCSRSEVIDFFKMNHIQGHVDGSYYVGLRYEGVLVACMTFKLSSDTIYDLSRFASSVSVLGGASKCLAFFKKNVEWGEIFTFASLDYSSGGVYESIGFTKQHTTDPNMWYMKRGQWIRLGRRRFTKSKLPSVLENFDPIKSERQNMQDNGYVRIFDCGSIRYSMINQ